MTVGKNTRRDVPFMIRKAVALVNADGMTRYLNPTAFGLALDANPAIGGVQHYRINRDGVSFIPYQGGDPASRESERTVQPSEYAK